MREMPQERSPDSTLALLRNPYGFISERCGQHQSDVFEARLLFKKTICMRGESAARLFYDEQLFSRHNAAPEVLRSTLFGNGGVQSLDGEPHRRRKAMFLGLMTPISVDRLARLTDKLWREEAAEWASSGSRIVLYDAARRILTRAVCEWAGVPLPAADIDRRTEQLTSLFQHAGATGPMHLRARLARRQTERWAGDLIEKYREGRLDTPRGAALAIVGDYREADGALLDRHTAAVELLNVLRPTVAVAVFISHAAVALHRHPESRLRITAGDEHYSELFVEEVRRFYPFFPAVVARVRHEFEWNGLTFPRDERVMLDLHGTNHDPRSWDDPEEFRPDRFARGEANDFNFVPQGGGDPAQHHRCPGEPIAVELMKSAINFLARSIRYEVPAQDLELNLSELPALPRSGFQLESVQLMQ